ncbi:MAG TPA: DNA polymerase III subunit delta' [Polyangia bacterium]|nr:DNA polymerase III subunit delta' [Polyangia bacterium]
MRLRDVLGQRRAIDGLARAVRGGHVPHAYLFEGPPGVGKRAAAHGLALALACAVEPGAGCGTCDVCRRIDHDLHPDVPTYAPDGPMIVIDQVNEIVALAQRSPHEARVRVVIVDDADAMNANAANALLKTLEEPAPQNHLVLCTSAPERLLPTIRSRTQRVRFGGLPTDVLLRIADAHGIDRARAETAIALSDGSAARMLASARDDDDAVWEAIDRLRDAVATPGFSAAMDVAAALGGDKEGKEALPPILALLARLHRDALVAAAGAPEMALFADRARDLATLGTPRLSRALAAVVEAQEALLANVNPTMLLERLLIELKRHARLESNARAA